MFLELRDGYEGTILARSDSLAHAADVERERRRFTSASCINGDVAGVAARPSVASLAPVASRPDGDIARAGMRGRERCGTSPRPADAPLGSCSRGTRRVSVPAPPARRIELVHSQNVARATLDTTWRSVQMPHRSHLPAGLRRGLPSA